jgi:hypothetical protein
MAKWIKRWEIQSHSDPDKTYTVALAEDGSYGCSCPQWKFRRRQCRHIAEVQCNVPETVERYRSISRSTSASRFIAECDAADLAAGRGIPSLGVPPRIKQPRDVSTETEQRELDAIMTGTRKLRRITLD